MFKKFNNKANRLIYRSILFFSLLCSALIAILLMPKPTTFPTLQTMFFGGTFAAFFLIIPLYNKFLFLLKKFSTIRKSHHFTLVIRFLLSIVFFYIIWVYFNNNMFFSSFITQSKNDHSPLLYIPVIITLIGSLLGVFTFYKSSRKGKIDIQTTQFYKLLDMLNAELKSKSYYIQKHVLDPLIKEINAKAGNKGIDEPVLYFVLLNTRVNKNHKHLYWNYKKFSWKAKHYKRYPDEATKRKVKAFINIINLFDDIQGSPAKSIPTNSQKKYTRILCSHIVNTDPNYSYLKGYVSIPNFQLSDNIYSILDKIGYTEYILNFLPKKTIGKNEIWRRDVKLKYIPTFKIINDYINQLDDDSLSTVCRYVHKMVKIVNHMSISVDDKYSLYGLIRSTLNSEILLAVFLNATFSFKGAGLARQLIGTSFFGDKSDIDKLYSQHINLDYLKSKDIKRLSKRILSQYYAAYVYPGNVKIRFIFLKIMNSTKKKEKNIFKFLEF